MILGIGIDLVQGGRIREEVSRSGEEFLQEFLSSPEIDLCRRRRDPFPCYAARFAAKEALAKALGTGVWGEMSWHEVWVEGDDRGRPTLHLTGRAREAAESLGVERTHVSLAHEGDLAVAVVVLEG
jgi:holo-[acyl-carrier protein] synthase